MTPQLGPHPDLDALRVMVPEAPVVPGLRFRRWAGRIDLPGMVRVGNAARGADGDPEVATLASLEVDYANLTNCDPATDILVADVAGAIVAYSRVFWEDMTDGTRGYHSFGFVDPPWRRCGIGRAMLRHNERRNLDIGTGHDPDRPRALISWGLDGALGNVALLHDSPEAMERWRGNPNWDPSLWVVAWAGDEVAGAVLNLVVPQENAEHGYRRGWLDSVFVRRPWRRRGLATALIGRSLVLLRERGMTSAQLGVDVDNDNRALHLYTNAGFQVHQRETVWRKPWPVPLPLPDGEPAALTWRRR